MENFLSKATREYADWVITQCNSKQWNKDNSLTAIRSLFPIDEEVFFQYHDFILSFTEVIPHLTDFLEDRDNVLKDRLIVCSALNYFISPIDLIPDEMGILGIVDDGLICFYLSRYLDAPSDQISQWIESVAQKVERVQATFPDWMTETITQVIASTMQQQNLYLHQITHTGRE